MASLPSGSRKNIELLSIETDAFTLVVKGDLNYDRYHNQFVPYSVEDKMKLHIDAFDIGDRVRTEILDARTGELVTYIEQDLPPIFFENGYYQIIIEPVKGRELSFYHEYAPFKEAITKTKRMTFFIWNITFSE